MKIDHLRIAISLYFGSSFESIRLGTRPAEERRPTRVMYQFIRRYWSLATIVCVLVDSTLLVIAVVLGHLIRFRNELSSIDWNHEVPLRALLFSLIVAGVLYVNDLYELRRVVGRRQLLVRLSQALAISAFILLAVYYAINSNVALGRGVFGLSLILSWVLLFSWRLLAQWVLSKEVLAQRLLIVGTDNVSQELAREVLKRQHLGYRLEGFLDDDASRVGDPCVNPGIIGTTADAADIATQRNVSRVVVGQFDRRGKLDMDGLLACRTAGIPVERGSSFYERMTGKIQLEGLRPSWLVYSQGFVLSRGTRLGKRSGDILFSGLGLILFAPLLLALAILVRLDSKGPVLYAQERVGLEGKPFRMWKFRSMRDNAEKPGVPVWSNRDDQRVTRVGSFLRRFRLDELPQLWNILLGDMAFVGPRPEREVFARELSKRSWLYELRYAVRPGLTGWAQIHSPYASSFDESLEKLQFDLFYIKHVSIFLDLTILASTFKVILFGARRR